MVPADGELAVEAGSETGGDETRQRILEAAALVFAEQGYARATTRALARAAGVNEVTLFRHFGSKQNLFASVIEQFGGAAITKALEVQLSGDYIQDLHAVGSQLLKVLLQRRDAMRLMLCEAEHFPEVQAVMVQNPRRLRHMLAAYFQQQIEAGRVRPLHPEAMAQAFAGMLFSCAILWGILEDAAELGLAAEELVAEFVDLFAHGTLVQGE